MKTSNDILSKIECSQKEKLKSFKGMKDYPLSTRVGIEVKDFIQKRLKVDINGNSNISEFDLDKDMFENNSLYLAHLNNAKSAILHFLEVFGLYLNGITFNEKKEVVLPSGKSVLLEADMFYVDESGKSFALNFHYKKPELTASGKKQIYNSKEGELLWLLSCEISKNPENSFGGIFYMIPKGSTLARQEKFNLKKQFFTHNFSRRGKDMHLAFLSDIDDTLATEDIQTISCDDCKYDFFCNYKKEVKANEIKEVKSNNIFGVDKDQLSVCLFTKGIGRVIAGPGSGKTKTITSRFSYLVSLGVNPNDILMFSFTNAAANEMKQRILVDLTKEGLNISEEILNITTFHGLGFKIISGNYPYFGYKKEPKQINRTEKYDLLNNVYRDYMSLPNGVLDVEKKILINDYSGLVPVVSNRYIKGLLNLIDEDISTLKIKSIYSGENDLFKDEEVMARLNLNNCPKTLKFFFNAYNRYLMEKSLVDYDDLIVKPLVSHRNGKKLTYFLPNIKHIFVDEFQDSNKEQMEIIKALIKGNDFQSLIVVGDPSQAIYGFNGTSPENFNEFKNELKPLEVKDFYLSTNYRSTREIVRVGENIELQQSFCIPKNMKALKSGTKPRLVDINKDSIGKSIAKQIRSEIFTTEFKNIAIIARTRKALKSIENSLSEAKIPFVYGVNEVVSFNSFLKPICEFGESLMNYNEEGYFNYLAMAGIINKSDDVNVIREHIERLKEEIDNSLEFKEDKPTQESVRKVFLTAMDKIKDERIARYIKEKSDEFVLFSDFIQYLNNVLLYGTDEVLEPQNEGKNAVTLTTAHSAKGREWDNVHIILDGFRMPVVMKDEPKERTEERNEEIRVLYVAATRAKENLTFYSSRDLLATSIVKKSIK